MRMLADENFPRPIVEFLRSQGHDVLWARTDCRGMEDHLLIELAEIEHRLVMTLDKDFLADSPSAEGPARALRSCFV
jgi:predicted nuclease of predicted toxin-antitoxin system